MKQFFGRSSLLIFISYVLFESLRGFQKIAWGTGVWWGEYSLKWGMAFILYCMFCILVIVIAWDIIFHRQMFQPVFDRLMVFRKRLGSMCRLFAVLLLIFPAWFFQYTPWGIVFSDIYIRIVIWSIATIGFAFFIEKGNILFGWKEFFIAVLLTSSEFVVFVPFKNVTDYPFSLGWSEGNRMWDYSIMFGRHLYEYPADKPIFVLLDAGRQLVGGLPFLIPGLTIQVERFWLGITVSLPYILLGFGAFRFLHKESETHWILAALWVLLFLDQGPIHPPLVLCAVAVSLLWRSPLWLAVPLIALTGYAAEESRFTWLFAPGMWLGMLELAGAQLQNGKLNRTSWTRAILLGLAGMAGGYLGPKVAGILIGNVGASVAVSAEDVASSISAHPLLWYRLLPNATYGTGILVGLLVATAPLIILLTYLAVSKKWRLNVWQVLAIITPLLAFLGVGLVVSAKIGGGGDLHNMDMFLIGLIFTAVIAWEKGGKNWFANIHLSPIGLKLVFLLLLVIPGFQSIGEMRSYDFAEDAYWIETLTDAPNENALNMYPSQDVTESSLEKIRREVAQVRSQGGTILFMDQRQLLTFGFIKNVPLVPEYEKKLLMNQALASDASYFKPFYADLAAKRFDLIVSEILRTPVKDSSFQFGEENNAWVKWVSIPTLCYYEPKVTLKDVGIQLLVPKAETSGCASLLPTGKTP